MAFIGGQGVEYWYNGLSRFPSLGSGSSRSSSNRNKGTTSTRGGSSSPEGVGSDSGSFIQIEASTTEDQVNGEKVEMEMARERRIQKVRSWIAGVGFAMGVVGIWGDGA